MAAKRYRKLRLFAIIYWSIFGPILWRPTVPWNHFIPYLTFLPLMYLNCSSYQFLLGPFRDSHFPFLATCFCAPCSKMSWIKGGNPKGLSLLKVFPYYSQILRNQTWFVLQYFQNEGPSLSISISKYIPQTFFPPRLYLKDKLKMHPSA